MAKNNFVIVNYGLYNNGNNVNVIHFKLHFLFYFFLYFFISILIAYLLNYYLFLNKGKGEEISILSKLFIQG